MGRLQIDRPSGGSTSDEIRSIAENLSAVLGDTKVMTEYSNISFTIRRPVRGANIPPSRSGWRNIVHEKLSGRVITVEVLEAPPKPERTKSELLREEIESRAKRWEAKKGPVNFVGTDYDPADKPTIVGLVDPAANRVREISPEVVAQLLGGVRK